jgi:hypothetical protein
LNITCNLLYCKHQVNRDILITHMYICRVIQEESAILWEMIVCVILSKTVCMNMGPIFNITESMVKRRYERSCEHEQQ